VLRFNKCIIVSFFYSKNIDFLGYHYSREVLELADITVRKYVQRIHQLYEQQKENKVTSQEMTLILGEYVKRWQRWCQAGLEGITIELYDDLLRTYRVDLIP